MLFSEAVAFRGILAGLWLSAALALSCQGQEGSAPDKVSNQSQKDSAYTLKAQADLSVLGVGSFIWAHTAEVKQLASSHPLGLQVEYHPRRWSTFDDAANYRRLRMGFTAGVLHFRQGRRLGMALPLAFSLSNCLTAPHRRVSLHYRVLAGIAYVTSPFSYPENRHNLAIGQPVVAALQIGLLGKARLSSMGNYLRFEAGLAHFSAGAFLMPNLGLNLPFIALGYQHPFGNPSPNQAALARKGAKAAPGLPRTSIWVLGAGGAKQAGYSYDPLRLGFTGRVDAFRRFGLRSAVSIGTDVIYNEALRDKRVSRGHAPAPLVRVGLTVGHEWLINSFAISTQLGAYVYNPAKGIDRPLYQRYGVRWNLSRRLQPAIFLRAHLGQADIIEASLAYRLFAR